MYVAKYSAKYIGYFDPPPPLFNCHFPSYNRNPQSFITAPDNKEIPKCGIKPLQVSVAVGSQLDFLATYAELAGVPVPNRTLDSHSLVPILFGGGYESQSVTMCYNISIA